MPRLDRYANNAKFPPSSSRRTRHHVKLTNRDEKQFVQFPPEHRYESS